MGGISEGKAHNLATCMCGTELLIILTLVCLILSLYSRIRSSCSLCIKSTSHAVTSLGRASCAVHPQRTTVRMNQYAGIAIDIATVLLKLCALVSLVMLLIDVPVIVMTPG